MTTIPLIAPTEPPDHRDDADRLTVIIDVSGKSPQRDACLMLRPTWPRPSSSPNEMVDALLGLAEAIVSNPSGFRLAMQAMYRDQAEVGLVYSAEGGARLWHD